MDLSQKNLSRLYWRLNMRQFRISLVHATKKKKKLTNPWQNLILTLPLYMQEVLLTVSLLTYTIPWHDFIMAFSTETWSYYEKKMMMKRTHTVSHCLDFTHNQHFDRKGQRIIYAVSNFYKQISLATYSVVPMGICSKFWVV